MSKEQLWVEVTRKTYLTSGQAYALIPLVRDNFLSWSYYRGALTDQIANKLAVVPSTADDIYERVNDIVRTAIACGVRYIY